MDGWTKGSRGGRFCKSLDFLFLKKKTNKKVVFNYFHKTKNLRLISLSMLVGGFYAMVSITYLELHIQSVVHAGFIATRAAIVNVVFPFSLTGFVVFKCLKQPYSFRTFPVTVSTFLTKLVSHRDLLLQVHPG